VATEPAVTSQQPVLSVLEDALRQALATAPRKLRAVGMHRVISRITVVLVQPNPPCPAAGPERYSDARLR